MPGNFWKCVTCIKMEYNVEEGRLPREFIEYDFAEDAMDYETQLAEARDIKFTQTLTEPLCIGSHIICTGTPTENLPWFAINIGCGNEDSERADIAVHFNVRLPQYYVVRNTRIHDKWGSEETTAYRLFPFKLNRPFTVEVLVDEKETLWAVDGEHYCSYAHRNPSPLTATWVQVTGIRDAVLKIQKTDLYPTTGPPIYEIPLRPSISHPRDEDEPIWRPNVIAKLSNGITEGHQVVIYGSGLCFADTRRQRVNISNLLPRKKKYNVKKRVRVRVGGGVCRLRPTLHSLAVDLLDVAREWPRANILAHANVRAHADAQRDRQLVVLNARLGAWGPERRQRTARLVPATYTTLRIVRGSGEWLFYADDVLIGELEFRASPNGVKALRIRGDLYPEEIFLCPSSTTPVQEK